jgi:TonB family protein
MMRSFGIMATALALLLSGRGNVFAQAMDPNSSCSVASGPELLTPLKSLIHYPEEARKNEIEGEVVMRALINKQGAIDSVVIEKSSDTIFNSEAIRVMKSARFTPLTQEGTPIKVWEDEEINFRLKDTVNLHE